MTSAPRILKSVVLALGCIVRVTGAGKMLQPRVITASDILVGNDDTKWRTGRHAIVNTAEDLEMVGFPAGSSQIADRAAKTQLGGDETLVYRDPRRQTIKNSTDRRPVTLTEQSQYNIVSETVFQRSVPPSEMRSSF